MATCSVIIDIVTTPRARQKLAEVFARMLEFYRQVLEWYLQSRFGRFMQSFRENLLSAFEDAKKELEDNINELYREAAVANLAMVAMVNGKMASLEMEVRRQRRKYEVEDALAGQRMQKMVHTTWSELRQLKSIIERATSVPTPWAEVSPGRISTLR